MEVRDTADKADITVWDDIGAAEYTRYDYINLLVPIERRILAGKFNIFTTNFTAFNDVLIDRLGDRLATRIWGTSDVIELRGLGMRGTGVC
jgi:DNA replication protein DnaC